MRKVLGYSFFLIGIGMLIMLILPNDFLGIVIILGLFLLGYNLFCC